MQVYWNQILDFFGNDDFNVRVYGTFLVSMVVYWGIGGLFTFVDVTGKPNFALIFKVQDNVKSYPLSRAQLLDLVTVVLRNQLLNFFLSILAFYSDTYRGVKYQVELPSLITAIGHFVFFMTIREITFYYTHRLFHHPYLYKRIHKKHHTWISPVAISARFNYNYGITGILDYLHGTDSLFRKSKQFLRNKRTFSLTPIKVTLP